MENSHLGDDKTDNNTRVLIKNLDQNNSENEGMDKFDILSF